MSSESFAVRLARQARPLRPARPPFFMRVGMPPGMPAPGWYMQHRADRRAWIYLGASYEDALRTLDRMVPAAAAAPALGGAPAPVPVAA